MRGAIRNATITKTMLGFEDHGIFTFFLYLDYGGSAQGAGGWGLSHTPKDKVIASPMLGRLIIKILQTMRVDTWEQLRGLHIRADHDNGKVHGIAHYLEDNWLYFDDFLNAKEEDK